MNEILNYLEEFFKIDDISVSDYILKICKHYIISF